MQLPKLTLVLSILFLACKPQAKKSDALVVPPLPADYNTLDLSSSGISGTIKVPAGTTAEKSTLSDNEGTRPYVIIRPFAIPSDAADATRTIQAKLEIYSTKLPFDKHKESIRFRPTIGWKSWLAEEPGFIVFTARPGNSIGQPIREKDAAVYHFLMMRKAKDGGQYLIGTSSAMDFTRDEMLKLLAIAKSLEL